MRRSRRTALPPTTCLRGTCRGAIFCPRPVPQPHCVKLRADPPGTKVDQFLPLTSGRKEIERFQCARPTPARDQGLLSMQCPPLICRLICRRACRIPLKSCGFSLADRFSPSRACGRERFKISDIFFGRSGIGAGRMRVQATLARRFDAGRTIGPTNQPALGSLKRVKFSDKQPDACIGRHPRIGRRRVPVSRQSPVRCRLRAATPRRRPRCRPGQGKSRPIWRYASAATTGARGTLGTGKIGQRLRNVGLCVQRVGDERDGLIEFAASLQNAAQQVQRVRLVRIMLQDGAVTGLRQIAPPSLMVRPGSGANLLDINVVWHTARYSLRPSSSGRWSKKSTDRASNSGWHSCGTMPTLQAGAARPHWRSRDGRPGYGWR